MFSLAFRNGLPQDNPLPVLSLAPDWREFGVYGKQVWAPVGKWKNIWFPSPPKTVAFR